MHRRPVTLDQLGTVFEQWVILQAIYSNRALRKGWRLSSYRTQGGAEVDLVIERADDIIGIEVKAGRNVSKADARGLLSLPETVAGYKPVKKWLIYNGSRQQLFDDGVHVFPVLEALDRLEQEA